MHTFAKTWRFREPIRERMLTKTVGQTWSRALIRVVREQSVHTEIIEVEPDLIAYRLEPSRRHRS